MWSLYCAIETCYINVLSFIFVMQKSICSVLKSLADIFVSETNILQKNPSPEIFLDCRETQGWIISSIFEEPETVESFVLLIENSFFTI